MNLFLFKDAKQVCNLRGIEYDYWRSIISRIDTGLFDIYLKDALSKGRVSLTSIIKGNDPVKKKLLIKIKNKMRKGKIFAYYLEKASFLDNIQEKYDNEKKYKLK